MVSRLLRIYAEPGNDVGNRVQHNNINVNVSVFNESK